MLLRLKVSNFLSFDSPIEFSLLASKESQHNSRVAEVEDSSLRALQASAIWGGNAAGKSNLCKVVSFCQKLVVSGTRPDSPTGRTPYRLREAASKEASMFEYEILVASDDAERVFKYSFSLDGRHILSESLTEIRKSSERVYFSRTGRGDPFEQEFKLEWWERSSVSEEDRLFARFIAKGTKPNQLFLHEAMDRNLTLLAPIFRWFRDQLTVIGPQDDFLSLEIQEPDRGHLREYIAKFLHRSDTGVVAMDAIEIPASSIGIPTSLQEQLMSSLKNGDGGVLLKSTMGDRFSVFRKEGALVAKRLVTYREGEDGRQIQFETSEESDGTLRVIDLAPLFYEFELPRCKKVFFVDELDRSLHTSLTRSFLERYLASRDKSKRAQLIFTTHDIMLLDQDLLRRDEIWFITHDDKGASKMQSLSSFKNIRLDRDIRKAYLNGHFSGKPDLEKFLEGESN